MTYTQRHALVAMLSSFGVSYDPLDDRTMLALKDKGFVEKSLDGHAYTWKMTDAGYARACLMEQTAKVA